MKERITEVGWVTLWVIVSAVFFAVVPSLVLG